MRVLASVIMLISQCFFAPVVFAAAPKKASVFIQEAKLEPVADRMVYPGRVRSKIEALVTAENEGLVQKILKPVGSAVKRGEVVLIIQNTDPVYKYAPVKVFAPTTGFLSRLDVSLMSKIEKGAALFMITDPGQLQVEVEIPAADLANFRIGIPAKIQLRGIEATAKITGLSPLVDPKTGTATAQLEFSKGGDSVRPGMIVQAAFEVNQRNAVILPSSALLYKESKPFVRLLENGKVKKVDVEVRTDLGGTVELAKGIAKGNQVITRSNKFLADGDEVEVESSKKE